jgi:uncharacterized membrane protein YqiK
MEGQAMNVLGTIVAVVVAAIVAIVILWLLFHWLYRRATNEMAFVRTGLGGQKVVLNGGAFVIPVLHEVTPVSMNTTRFEVQRREREALITRDRIRADVTAEFYVRVQAQPAAIARAAQSLGVRTTRPDLLKELLEGKFVDALRSVAAESKLEELHQNRIAFIRRVREIVAENLELNGLELESASLTALDQTDRQFFNPTNAFDAEGLTWLTNEIENRRRLRNDIEQESSVAIMQKDLDTERRRLEIRLEEEQARLDQQREMALYRAAQSSAIATEEAAKRRDAEEATIRAEHNVVLARIQAEQEAEERRLRQRREVQQQEIGNQRQIDLVRVEQQQAVTLAEQEREIALADHSRRHSEAQAAAAETRSKSVEAEEALFTLRELRRAERDHQLQLVAARTVAEKEAISTLVAAETERKAIDERIAGNRVQTEAQSRRIRLMAEAEPDAEESKTKAAQHRYAVEAEAQRAMHQADNLLSTEIVHMKLKLALIEKIQDIVRESVRPMENIEGIKIIQVDGLNGRSVAGEANGHNGNLADQVVSSALRYRGMAPVVDALLAEIGLGANGAEGLSQALVDRLKAEHGTPPEGRE